MGDREKITPKGSGLLYVLPLLGVLVLGISLFYTSSGARIDSVQVLGGPTDGPSFRGRLRALRESEGVQLARSRVTVRLFAEQGRHHTQRLLRTDDEGWAEFEIPRISGERLVLHARDEMGETLVKGAPELSTRRWAHAARRRGGARLVHKEGVLSAQVLLEPPILAVPFPALVSVKVQRAGVPAEGARIRLDLGGARLAESGKRSANFSTGPDGSVSAQVVAEQHVTSVRGVVDSGTLRLAFDQVLPVVPGSFWIKKENDALLLEAPILRSSVWYTFVTEKERLGGGRLPLTERADGTAVARLLASEIPKVEGLYLVLASDADGRSESTVGFPLAGQAQTFDAWDGYLLDGYRQAKLRADTKYRRVRWILGAYAGLLGLLTLWLFVLRVRRAERALAQALSQAGASAETQDQRLLPLVIAVVGLFFAFSLGVLWIVAR